MTTDDTHDTAGSSGPHLSPADLRRELDGDTNVVESERITAHLDGCEACGRLLDELADTTLVAALVPEHDPPTSDASWMRRAVRRTMFSIAWRTAVLLVLVAFAAQLAGALLIHPLFVDRGDRLERHVVASLDLPVLLRPGAEVREIISNTGVLRRTTEVRYDRAVGADRADLGTYRARLGPLATTTATGGPVTSWAGPRLSEDPVDSSPVPFDPTRADDATAATIELTWTDVISRDRVAELASAHRDVALTWVGFRIGGFPAEDPGSVLGYSACAQDHTRLLELIGGPIRGGFGTSGGFRVLPPPEDGVEHALAHVRRATQNLARTGWLDDEASLQQGPLGDVAATATWLGENDPEVASIVLTGPTTALADIVASAEADRVNLLELELDRGSPEPCG